MLEFINIIQRIFQPRKKLDHTRMEELRHEFKSRFQDFKLLLNANNQALETMAEIENAPE